MVDKDGVPSHYKISENPGLGHGTMASVAKSQAVCNTFYAFERRGSENGICADHG